MKIYMDMDYIVGRLRYGHLEGEINFTEEQEKDFKTILKKELNKEEITEEELNRLDGYKRDIRDCSIVVVDDWRIDDCGDYHWEELLED